MSLALVNSRARAGVSAPPVRVEVHLSGGLPSTHMVYSFKFQATQGAAVPQKLKDELSATTAKLIKKPAGAAPSPAAKAYSYIRMSTKDQLQGDSLRRQYEKTEDYVRANNLELVENYDDIGVSAFRGANEHQGKLGEFLAALKSGVVAPGSYLIVESMDRLTRQSPVDAITTFNEIILSGVIVVTLDDGMKYSKEEFAANQYKLFIAVGAMVRAHDESLRKSGLLSDVWSEKRRNLAKHGKILTAMVPAWLRVDKTRNVIEEIPERVAIVQEIFDLTCNGYGIYSIARLFNERGEKAWGITRATKLRPKRKGKPIWRDSYIKKIITNRAVLGEFQPHKSNSYPGQKKIRTAAGEVMKDYYPAIISPEVFRDAHLAMEKRKNGARGRKGSGYANLLTGMVHCQTCGSAMRYLDKGGRSKDSKYLKCSVAVSGGGCDTTSYRYEPIEKVVLHSLESLDIQKILSGEAISVRIRQKKGAREIARIELDSITDKISNLNRAMIGDSGPLPSSTLSLLRSLEHDQERMKAQVALLDSEIDDLLVIDPEKRKAVLDQLMIAIRDEDQEKRGRSRRALAGELQRMIDTIVLRRDIEASLTRDPTEPSWSDALPSVPPAELEMYLKDYGFEMSIRYRNGAQQLVRGLNMHKLKLPASRRFSRMKNLKRFAAE